MKIKKPSLRGYLHQEAFYVALGACAMLIAKSSHARSRIAAIIYSFGLLFMLGCSAVYHRPDWAPRARSFMKRLDHSAIYIVIAATFTPFGLLALPPDIGHRILIMIWSVALAGVLKVNFWVSAPKWLSALLYVIAGWLAVPYLGAMKAVLGTANLVLIAIGGLAYTLGAVFYALERPRLAPATFGYHELFHSLIIFAATAHFIVVYQLIR